MAGSDVRSGGRVQLVRVEPSDGSMESSPPSLLIAVVAAILGFVVGSLAIAVDLASEEYLVVRQWAEVPQIMRDRVPWYVALTILVPAVASVLLVLLARRVRRNVWLVAVLVFGLGCGAFGFLTLQLVSISYELTPEETPTIFGWAVVVIGWILTIAAGFTLLRR